jgi:hypothetical protein
MVALLIVHRIILTNFENTKRDFARQFKRFGKDLQGFVRELQGFGSNYRQWTQPLRQFKTRDQSQFFKIILMSFDASGICICSTGRLSKL